MASGNMKKVKLNFLVIDWTKGKVHRRINMGKRKEEKRQIFWPKQVARPTADQSVQWDYPLFALTSKSSDFSHNNERQFGGQKRGGHIVEQIGREKRGFCNGHSRAASRDSGWRNAVSDHQQQPAMTVCARVLPNSIRI